MSIYTGSIEYSDSTFGIPTVLIRIDTYKNKPFYQF